MELFIGNNNRMKKVYEEAIIASKNDLSILIEGETGVGKDILARYIHSRSERSKSGEFILVNCTTIPKELFESELFGHVKGSFTGAHIDRKGFIKEADKGTLFLNEIGDLELPLQAKLLHVFEYKEYYPVGSSKIEKSDFRLICATNRDIKELKVQRKFREDLFQRICTIPIIIPPLRERVDEINDLVEHFKEKLNRDYLKMSQDVLEIFLCYHWPGNIRELKSMIELTVSRLEKDCALIEIKHIPFERFNNFCLNISNDSNEYKISSMTLKERVECFEKMIIKKMMESYDGDYKKVMQILEISRSKLYELLN